MYKSFPTSFHYLLLFGRIITFVVSGLSFDPLRELVSFVDWSNYLLGLALGFSRWVVAWIPVEGFLHLELYFNNIARIKKVYSWFQIHTTRHNHGRISIPDSLLVGPTSNLYCRKNTHRYGFPHKRFQAQVCRKALWFFEVDACFVEHLNHNYDIRYISFVYLLILFASLKHI